MENKNKLLVIFLILLSNICSYIIGSPTAEYTQVNAEVVSRPDYVEIQIEASPKTEIKIDTPLTLTNQKRNIYIPNVFVLKQIAASSLSESMDSFSKTYLIHIHQNYLKTLLSTKNLELFPLLPEGIVLHKTNRTKGKNYEVVL